MKIIGIIPARYASSRFPGKPLCDIAGKTMVQRVYEQASKSISLHDVYVATDDQRIYDHVTSFGGKVCMSSDKHRTGTERCAEVVGSVNGQFDVAINIQGDEPFIDPKQIDRVADQFIDPKVQIATLVKPGLLSYAESIHHIKVVTDLNGKALYFSRSRIPYFRDTQIEFASYYIHVGIYGYRLDVLKEIAKLEPSPLEKAESLEQLRWLENGYTIHTALTDHESMSIDTPDELKKVIEKIGKAL